MSTPYPAASTREIDRSVERVAAGRPVPSWLWGSLLFLVAVVVPLFRQSGTRSWQTIWAEDGFEYFQQAYQHGALAVLLRGYGGYLQLPPRLLAIGSTIVPIRALPLYLALAGSLTAALLAWFLYYVSNEWVPSRLVRLALASLVVLMPVLGAENTANITNTIWVFAAVAPWALVSLGEGAVNVTVRSIVAFLAATSTSLCFLYLPIAVGFVLIRRTRDASIVAAAFTAGLVVQAAVVLHTKDIVSFIPSSLLGVKRTGRGIVDATGVHVFSTFLIGSNGASQAWLTQHFVLIVGSIILFMAIIAVLMVGAARDRQLLAAVFIAYAVTMFVVPAWSRRDAAPRYSVIPVLLLASAVAVLVADPARDRIHWITRLARPALVAQIVVLMVIGFSVTSYRSADPSWLAAVTIAQKTECAAAPPGKVVTVKTDELNAWPVHVRCADLST